MRLFLKRIVVSIIAISPLYAHAAFEAFSQDSTALPKENVLPEELVFEIVEQTPIFPGGTAAMLAFIAKNLVYPSEAKANDIQGTVIVEFIVEKDGSLSNIKIIKDIGGGCGEAVSDVIATMPLWEPGMQRDEPVRVKMKAPVKFRMASLPPDSE
jgi:periplasmic protein TonB